MRRLLLVVALLFVSSSVSAQETRPPDTLPPPIASPAPGLWARGTPRTFFGTILDAGFVYVRPRLMVGYGKPYWSWVGVEAAPTATSYEYGGYGGVRLSIPVLDVRVGARYTAALQHHFLPIKHDYDTLDLASTDGPKARYSAIEAEASGALPLIYGTLLGVGSVTRLQGVPAGLYVFDETLRVIAAPPWIWRARLVYAVRLGHDGNGTVGLAAELLGMPGRDAYAFRGGVIASFAVSEHLEALFSLLPPLKSIDKIGLAGGDFGQLGIRYRWATGTGP